MRRIIIMRFIAVLFMMPLSGCRVDVYKRKAVFTVAGFNRTDPGRHLVPMVNGSGLRAERFAVLPPGNMDRYQFELPTNNQCGYTTGFEPNQPCQAILSLAFRDAGNGNIVSSVCEAHIRDDQIRNFEIYTEMRWDYQSQRKTERLICREVAGYFGG